MKRRKGSRWSRARKRYERQRLLVEAEALEQAEQECLASEAARARRRERETARRDELDQECLSRLAERVHELFPGCLPERAAAAAELACLKSSSRVGRSAAAKELDEATLRLAVVAHVRCNETQPTTLLMQGYDRREARETVQAPIARTLADWERTVSNTDGF